ncbi:MAG TPA: efflux transporter outer membrane subunit [Burkholderiales bacterium]|nr:efflux transporter outer membrane subunit [Burkholderiales bacterium]
MRARHAIAIAAIAATISSGCTVGPDYVKPQVETPPAWRIEYSQAADAANTRWWEQFGDPVLTDLIETALRENRDLVIAAARVDAFLGQLNTTRAQFYPQAGYDLNASRNRSSTVGVTPLPAGTDPYYTLYQASLGASWQIDLFGRVRRQSEAARAQVYSTEQGRRGVVLSLVTSMATSYIGLRALDRQLEISTQTVQNYGNTLRIFELRHKGGFVSKLELAQIRSQYQQALAAVPSLEQQIAAQENLIAVLQGRNPYLIPRGKSFDELAIPGIPGGLPSTLLERRPDILQAEQDLVAANANIGAAKALYYPQLSLTGLFGSVSTAFGDFLSGPATTWAVAADFAGPVFSAGAIAGQVTTAEAGTTAALASYQQTVLIALRETNDALTGTVKKRQESEALADRVTSLREYARLSRTRFDNGYADYIEVLYAENELFAAELTAVRSKADRYAQVVAVYRALGGGWIDLADQSTAAGKATPVVERADKQKLLP